MGQIVAYLSGAKLHLLDPEKGGPPEVIESKYGEDVRSRAAQIKRRNDWKKQGRGAQFMAGGLLWGGVGDDDPSRMRIAIRGLASGREPGELMYAMDTDEVGGLFALDDAGVEHRLFHSAEQRVDHISAHPDQDLIACSVREQQGISNIAVMRADGSDIKEVTEGDSVDLAPSWIPGRARQLVMQSAGVGRDSSGAPVGLGPFSVQRLDLDQGELSDLMDDPKHDLLGPKLTTDGDLVCIRRPYKAPRGQGSPLRAMLDFLLFPLRLLFALFQWLNFFTARYTGRPLTTAGGPERQGADVKQMMVWGNLIDAEQAAKGHQTEDDTPAMVPASWQLIRRSEAGDASVLARGVLSFDLCDDGSIVYTNGSAIYLLDPSGKRRRLHRAEHIEQLALVDRPV